MVKMIQKLNHTRTEIAEKIYQVFQESYVIEAELLGVAASNFPPLQRTVYDFLQSTTQFFGYVTDEVLTAVMEIRRYPSSIHIQSLVVHPSYFRLGIGRKLIQFAFDHFETELFHVETGADNGPARALYSTMGFTMIKEWNTEINIRKVRFEKYT